MALEPQPPINLSLVTGNLGSLNAILDLELQSFSTGTIQVTGTWVGTLTFTLSNDDFVTSYAANFSSATVGLTNTTTVNGNFRVYGVSGYKKLRAQMTGYTSGTATVTLTGSMGNATQVAIVNGLFQSGEVPSFDKPLLIGGRDPSGGAARTWKVNSSGEGLVILPESPTYWVLTGNLTFTANRFQLVIYVAEGSATVLKLRYLVWIPTPTGLTGALTGAWTLRARRTPTTNPSGTGGLTIETFDSSDGSPTGVSAWSNPGTIPSGGTTHDLLPFKPTEDEIKLSTLDQAGQAGMLDFAGITLYDAHKINGKPLTIRADQCLEVQQGATAGTGGGRLLAIFTAA